MRRRPPTQDDPLDPAQESGASTEGTREDAQQEMIRLLALERDQARDQMLRALADLQNFRRRAEQERTQIRQFATEQLILDLLPVLDNFERTLAALGSGASLESVRDGVAVIERQLRGVLESRQVQRLPVVGQPFDPDRHEALGSVESDDHPEGSVAEEIEAGYTIGSKVIRPARVRIAGKPS